MNLRQTIYNSIGLGVAGFSALLVPGNLLRLARANGLPHHHPAGFLFCLIWCGMAVFLIGGGSLVNLGKGRLQFGATIAMSITYCLSIILIPLGIWGIIELQAVPHQRHGHPSSEGHRRYGSTELSATFLRQAAMWSWGGPAGGFVLFVLCGSTHIRPLIGMVTLLYALVILSCLILGLVALFGVRAHGSRGLLIPSLIGVSICGIAILFVAASLAFARADLRQVREHAAAGASLWQTNSAP
jgi:hypothetical protein